MSIKEQLLLLFILFNLMLITSLIIKKTIAFLVEKTTGKELNLTGV